MPHMLGKGASSNCGADYHWTETYYYIINSETILDVSNYITSFKNYFQMIDVFQALGKQSGIDRPNVIDSEK